MNTLPSATDNEAILLEQQIIAFHERLIREAKERLKLLGKGDGVIQPAQEPDPPKNGGGSTRTA